MEELLQAAAEIVEQAPDSRTSWQVKVPRPRREPPSGPQEHHSGTLVIVRPKSCSKNFLSRDPCTIDVKSGSVKWVGRLRLRPPSISPTLCLACRTARISVSNTTRRYQTLHKASKLVRHIESSSKFAVLDIL